MTKARASSKLLTALLAGFGLLAVAQLVPYGHNHSNPPVSAEPKWDSPETRALSARACFDCHSNEVRWPWYSKVAPVSWLVQHDVDEGRSVLNFSEWDRTYKEAHDAVETVVEGEMPLKTYVLMHPEARLTGTQKDALVRGLAKTIGGSAEKERGED